MTNRLKILLILLLLTSISTFSQKKNFNIWYFGYNAGIDFNTGSPLSLTNGEIYTREGCASICNDNGKLLFYTDGISIWDRNHNIMPNGINLMGDPSATQSAIIVPAYQQPNIFYIFTVDNWQDDLVNGLRYSIVDMSLNNGKGDVVSSSKNILLHDKVSEKLCAIMHQNQKDVWIVAHDWGSDKFLAYLLTKDSLSTTPVITSIGVSHEGNYSNAVGYMKASMQNDRIALAIKNMNTMEIFDFDNSTGKLSNVISVDNIDRAYGVEFSPDGSKLYVSSLHWYPYRIYQFDLELSSSEDIINSATIVASSYDNRYCAMQITPLGDMYISLENNKEISRFKFPNKLRDSCGLEENFLYLKGDTCQSAFPPMPVREKNNIYIPDTTIDTNICYGDSLFLENSYQTQEGTYYDTLLSDSGIYYITTINLHLYEKLFLYINGIDTLCIGQTDTLSAIASGGTPGYTYYWSDTSMHGKTINVTPSSPNSFISAYFIDTNNCISPTANFTITLHPPLSVNIISDSSICKGDTIILTALAQGGNGNYSYTWNTQIGNPIVEQPDTTTTYWVSVSDNCGTPPVADTTTVIVHNQFPKLLSIDSVEGCEPLTVTFTPIVSLSDNKTTYCWTLYNQTDNVCDSEDSIPTYTYQNNGIYDVGLTLTSKYGCKFDTIIKNLVSVYPRPNASFKMDPQSTGIFNPTIHFFDNSKTNITKWHWYFGDNNYAIDKNPIHSYNQEGTYKVTLIVGTKHNCFDTISKLLQINPEHTFYAPTAFSPGTDLYNNYWYPKGVEIDSTEFHMWIYDRWGQIIYESNILPKGFNKLEEIEGGWNGRYHNSGDFVPPDIYAWLIKLVDINGNEYQYSGTVIVIR